MSEFTKEYIIKNTRVEHYYGSVELSFKHCNLEFYKFGQNNRVYLESDKKQTQIGTAENVQEFSNLVYSILV